MIVTDPQADACFWAEALNLGAYDLLAQPFYEPEVRRILYNACSRPPARAHGHSRRIMVSPPTEKPCPPPPMRSSNRIRPRLLEELKQFLRIPSISTLPENRADIERAASFVADSAARRRHGECRAHPDRQTSAGLRRLAARPRQAHRSVLRPLRCAARRSAGTLDHPALRAHRARRQPLRPRHGRRQGPDVHAHQGHRGAARRHRHAARQRKLPGGRRGGGRRRVHREVCRRKSRKAAAPMSPWSPIPRCTPKACRRSASGCAD